MIKNYFISKLLLINDMFSIKTDDIGNGNVAIIIKIQNDTNKPFLILIVRNLSLRNWFFAPLIRALTP